MAAMLMVSIFPLFGVLGKGLKPVPFILILAPVLATMVLASSYHMDFSWYEKAGLFYFGLALAEFGYLGAICLWSGDDVERAANRVQGRNVA